FDLTMDLTVPEVMERGFSPDMPWSLYIAASTRPTYDGSVRILTADVFRRLPFSSLGDGLTAELEAGLATLRPFTLEAINERGRRGALRVCERRWRRDTFRSSSWQSHLLFVGPQRQFDGG